MPEDEYQSYVWPVHKLLIDGAPREDVVAYLRWAADENITVPVPENRLQAVVDNLMALGLRQGESKS